VSEGARAEHAVRRPVERRNDARRLGDRGRSTVEVVSELAHAAAQQQGVPVAVHGDLVPGGHDLARERGAPSHLLADEKERRGRSPFAQDLEDRGRPFPMRPVVERQGDPVRVGEAARNAVRRRDEGRDRCGGGAAPQCRPETADTCRHRAPHEGIVAGCAHSSSWWSRSG
jgi:hypothetical protein